MKKRLVMMSLLIMSLSAASLTGCGSKDETTEETAIEEVTEEPETENEDAEKDEDKDSDAAEDETKTDEEEQTPLDEIKGEGTTDDEIPDLTDVETVEPREDAEVADENGSAFCTLTVTNAEITEERDENNEDNPDLVIVIDYSYTNQSDEDLLIDDMSFKLLDENGNLCDPYYAGFLKSVEPVAAGETGDAQIAFGVSSDFGEGTLVFTNSNAETTAFTIRV